jgi:hypothetical protein|eukprot:4457642-Prymnesium_polylepis.2
MRVDDHKYGLIRHGGAGQVVAYAEFDCHDLKNVKPLTDTFFDNMGHVCTPVQCTRFDDEDFQGLGWGMLDDPTDAFKTNNRTPHLGDYVMPLDTALHYFRLDLDERTVRAMRKAVLKDTARLFNKFQTAEVPSEEHTDTTPWITIALP